jgi:hypothetical protein
MGQITKKQHYVPQFLLSGFGAVLKNNSKVNIFDVETKKILKNQSIKDVFAQNYFYDKENTIENYLSINIEGPASTIINQFRSDDYSRLNDNGTELIKFICCQNSRTVEAADDALNFINASFHQVVSDISRLNDWDVSDPTKFNLTLADKDTKMNFNAELALRGIIDSLGLEDLRFHVLKNNTDSEFIISDHAVTRYNWLYRDLDDVQVGSMLAKGVQLFLPISSDIYLCVYDSKIYKYGDKSSSTTMINEKSDVQWLNNLQMKSARSFIAFLSDEFCETVLRTYKKRYGEKVYSRNSSHIGQECLENGTVKAQHVVYTTQARLNTKPTFFKIKKKSRKYSSNFEERDPDKSQELMMLKKHLRDKRSANEVSTTKKH